MYYRKSSQGWKKHVDFLILDILAFHLSFILAYMTRQRAFTLPYSNEEYRNMAIVMILIVPMVDVFFATMKNVRRRGLLSEIKEAIKQSILILLFSSLYIMTARNFEMSRIVIYVSCIYYVVIGVLLRLLWKRLLLRYIVLEPHRRVLIVTHSAELESIVKTISSKGFEAFTIAGFAVLDKSMIGEEIGGYPVVADRETYLNYACREWIDEVFLYVPLTGHHAIRLTRQFNTMGIVTHVNIPFEAVESESAQKTFVEKFGSYTVLTTTINYATARQVVLKRLMDIAGGLVGCLFTLLLIIIIGPIIFISSPGNIFFSQIRVGKNGKKFRIFKFRSMYKDAEERKKELMEQNRVKDGMMFKMDFDPRIIGNKILPDGTTKTGIGELIRNLSLDEFPQFLNCVLGSMSLVGTRPPTVDEWEKYELHHRARLATKPGITGMWQVSGRSNITDFEEVVRLDQEYIRNWSIGLDIKIMFRTVIQVLKRDGSM